MYSSTFFELKSDENAKSHLFSLQPTVRNPTVPMRYLRVVLPLLCVREACAEPKTGAAALELDTRPLEGAPPLLDGTERGARGEPLLGPTQVNQYKELQTIKMKNDAMFGEVKTVNKIGRIDLTWESDTLGA